MLLTIDQGRLQRALAEQEKFIQSMPNNEKTDYMKAMTTCPDLVTKESDPVRFLRCCQWDPQRSAKRLVQYWKTRRTIFGERAFLPLDQTGDGTLDRKDLNVLSSSYMMILPNDTSGHSVLFCDGSRLARSSRDSRLRCTFYMFSVAAENEVTQADGAILIYVLTEPSFDRASRECLDMTLGALPMSIRTVHLIGAHHDDSSEGPLGSSTAVRDEAMDPSLLSYLQRLVHSKERVHMHRPIAGTSAAQLLQAFGLPTDGIPRSLGGKFGFDRFAQWQELRVRYEWDLPAGLNTNEEDAAAYDLDKARLKTTPGGMTEEERVERKRKLNVIHSRRRRDRERFQIELLNEDSAQLRAMKISLKRENDRLEDLLRQAEKIIQGLREERGLS